jgi:hypothetical protein
MASAGDVIEKYLTSCEKNHTHSPEALVERQRVHRGFAAEQVDGKLIGERELSECLPHFLSDWIEANPKWKSSSTRKAKANAVNGAFNWAARGRRIADNPFRSVNYPEADPRPPMPDEDLEKIVAKANFCLRPPKTAASRPAWHAFFTEVAHSHAGPARVYATAPLRPENCKSNADTRPKNNPLCRQF